MDVFPGFAPQGIEGVARRVLDAAMLMSPFDGRPDLRYMRLGTVEIVAALPEGHQLAALDRVPREAFLRETVIVPPSTVNPTLVAHIRGLVFDGKEPPNREEVAEFAEASRLLRVQEGRGVATTLSFFASELPAPGVVFRRFEEPTPYVDHGIVWLDPAVSMDLPRLLEVAREVAAEDPSPGFNTGEQVSST